MLVNRVLSGSALLVGWCGSLLFGTVQDSIIPQVEHFETIHNLPMHKYAPSQFQEISRSLEDKQDRIRLISYNVLFDRYDAQMPEVNRWPQRCSRIVELLDEMKPDVIGVQELRPAQLNDLFPATAATFDFYSTNDQEGELDGIFYRKDRFRVVDCKVWYMGKATLTMLQLEDLRTDKMIAVFNTHLSFSKVEQREFQARFIAEKLETFAEQMPVVLTGDFNTFPNRLDLEKLPFYDGDYIHRVLTQGDLRDARDVSLLGHLGPLSTFSNDPEDISPFMGTGTPGVFLDHIMVSSRITVLIHAVQPAKVDGHFPSDHFPVLVDLVLR